MFELPARAPIPYSDVRQPYNTIRAAGALLFIVVVLIWSYLADPPEDFFSKARGGAQQLPNGNVLITETDKGRAFEVTLEGEIVWEFYNDVWRDRRGKNKRGAIYRMTRVDPDVLPTAPKASEDL